MIRLKRLAGSSTGIIFASTGVASGSSYLVSKAIAVTSGTSGLGLYGAAIGMVSLTLAVGQLGVPNALPALIGTALSRRLSRQLLLTLFSTSLLVAIVATAILGIAQSIFDSRDVIALGVLGLAGLQVVFYSVISAVFIGPRFSAATSALSVTVSNLISSLAFILAPTTSIPIGLACGAVGSMSISAYVAVVIVRRGGDPSINPSSLSWRKLVGNSSVAWLSNLFAGGALALYPIAAVTLFGSSDAGLVKAGLSLSAVILYLGNGSITHHRYPSMARESGNQVSRAKRHAMKRTAQSLLPLTAILSLLSPVLLLVLFSEEFVEAWWLVPVFATAYFMRVLTGLNTAMMSVIGRNDLRALTELAFSISLVAWMFWSFQNQTSLSTFAVGLLIASLASLLFSMAVTRERESS